MELLIEYMKYLGWEEVDGIIRHPNCDIDFKSWTDAIKSCIEVGTP